MNKRILRLAIPNIISNVTIPLLGLISVAIAGGLGSDGAIAAIGIGATIFNFIYWNCGFLRMGTSGMTAQALGARNLTECANLLVRALIVALALAVLILSLQVPIGNLGTHIMEGSDEVMAMVGEYFFARVWAAPATISLYAIHGWFIGMQNSRIPMWISIAINLISICLSYIFVYWYGMGVAGIAYGIVVAQYTGLAISGILWWAFYRRFLKYIKLRESLRLAPMMRFFKVNMDIFLRTFCNVCVYTFFTFESAHYGVTVIATNSILIQLFTLFSYMSDGFGYAAEALTGRFTGALNFSGLRTAIRYMFFWCGGIAVIWVVTYGFFWEGIISFFNASQDVLDAVWHYRYWIMVLPLLGFAPFLMDGILIGATRTRILRNSMALSTIVFFGLYFAARPAMGNDALWLSFIVFLVSRGVTQFFLSDKLRVLYRER